MTKIVKTQTWIQSILSSTTTLTSNQQETKKKKKTCKCDKYDYKGLITDRPHLTLICGKKGSGKSHLCCKLLLTSWRYKYDDVIFVSPTFRSQFDGLWNKLSPDGIVVHETLTEDLVNNILASVSNNKQRKTLLVLDDCGEEFRKISPRVVNLLISNSRHYNLSIVCLHQRLLQSPPIVRSNADVVIAFAACSYQEIECLWKMVATVPRRQFQAMFAECTQTQNSFMVCMVSLVDKGGRLKFYQC